MTVWNPHANVTTDRMNPPRETFKKLIQERGVTRPQVARSVNITPRTLENVLSGNAVSSLARERITNFFQKEIWPGTPLTERAVLMPAGAKIEVEGDEAAARAIVAELGDGAELQGTTIVFIKPTALVISRKGESAHVQLQPLLSEELRLKYGDRDEAAQARETAARAAVQKESSLR